MRGVCVQACRAGVNRIRLWPLRRDDHSGVLIGAGGMQRSDWPERVYGVDVSARSDRCLAGEERSIARMQDQAANPTEPLQGEAGTCH